MAFIGFSSASPQFRKVLANAKRRVIVYIAVSSKIINGSPANSIDVVPAQPWPQTP
jgi:catabolite regulation protein CreA